VHKNILNAIDSRLQCFCFVKTTYSTAMIVCICRRVSDREIARHVRAGLDFDDIQMELGVATQCGQCESCARDVVAQCCASQPQAAIRREDSWVGGPALAVESSQ
jgi:bacterioferritin-associated ferredoxin